MKAEVYFLATQINYTNTHVKMGLSFLCKNVARQAYKQAFIKSPFVSKFVLAYKFFLATLLMNYGLKYCCIYITTIC